MTTHSLTKHPEPDETAYPTSPYTGASAPRDARVSGGPGRYQHPALSPADRRNWAYAAHLSPLVAATIGAPLAGPLAVFLYMKNRDQNVRDNAAESLNFQISVLLAMAAITVVGAVGGLFTFGLAWMVFPIFVAGIAVAAPIFSVIATVAASRDGVYRYPLTLRLIA